MFTKANINPVVENIYKQIKNYNDKSESSNLIKFVHGGSSAIFSFIGREVIVHQKNGEMVNNVIPNALIPTGLLRTNYGIYPVSGELEIGAFGYGSRRFALNYHYLSGVKPTYQGLLEAYNYANFPNRVHSEEKIREVIDATIKFMDRSLYLRSLKMLLMHMTNLILLSKNKQETESFANSSIQLLKNKHHQLKLENPDNKKMDDYFNKYIPKLENIILRKTLPFVSDENFINGIKNQYPLILCANVTPVDFTDGVPDEQIYRGELDMNNIKIIFVSDEHIEDLKGKLEKIGLQSIQIMSYQGDLALNQNNEYCPF